MKKNKLFITIKKISIIFIILFSFLLGVIFEHYKLYPRNEIVFIIKKILFNELKISKSTKQCFVKLKNINNDKNTYKNILIIGHAYGHPYGTNNGIYPKLINHLNSQKQEWDYIISAGDSVKVASRNNFIIASNQLKKFSNNVIFVPGNHEIGTIDKDFKLSVNIFLNQFKTLFNFIKISDTLIFTINTNNKGWNVDEIQKLKIKKIIEENPNTNNIIIISHQLIWANKFKNLVFPNNIYPKDTKSNFNEFENFLKNYNKNLFFVSGDVGALYNRSHTFCKTNQNISYIATGMGSGLHDNYLTVNIFNKTLNINKKIF